MDYEEDYELLTLPGAWARERRIQRRRIGYGRQSAASIRGESGHQEHPFIALVTLGTTQTQGDMQCILSIPAIFWDRWKCRSMT